MSTDLELNMIKAELRAEQRKTAELKATVEQLQRRLVSSAQTSEIETEGTVNKLLSDIRKLKIEKEALARAVDVEGEKLVHVMQRKLANVEKEKVEMGIQLETEQEFIVNRLGQRMAQILQDKMKYERTIAAEKEEITEALKTFASSQEDSAPVPPISLTDCKDPEACATAEKVCSCVLAKQKDAIATNFLSELDRLICVLASLHGKGTSVSGEEDAIQPVLRPELIKCVLSVKETLSKKFLANSGNGTL